ncbi:class I SAM-dependent methyltransferase [Roseimaritima ulvae]|uniref:Demethylrebeccamycin-D-glucose O-methyltransferase n=1 Tax=Roseimaritima ulvae TaxID=980254 RepID=A0A5B9QYF0_9BACT|nr:class I SAM-dependent methyltransferase [Roseimaritima ulvae]QEG42166.1 Demethylrebeccamycin-D-glucose O-methyltransferase [Roseimaritima ulvae]
MLTRVLEPEFNDDVTETAQYDAMDHAAVNQAFVDDLVATGSVGPDILDLGTGTARIPILLCQRLPDVRVMAIDAAVSMLERAQANVDIAGLLERIQLEHEQVKDLDVFADQMFDCVISNSILHHLPEPALALQHSLRLVKPGGRVFHRDLFRPETEQQVEQLVDEHVGDHPEQARQLLRQSLHAALTVDEARQMAVQFGLAGEAVQQTSDRHWTLSAIAGPELGG